LSACADPLLQRVGAFFGLQTSLKQRAITPQQRKSLNAEDYAFDTVASTSNRLVFRRCTT
jgi:hypothetical protein